MTTDADKIDNLLAQRRELMDKIEEQIDERGRIIERIQSAPDSPIARLRARHQRWIDPQPDRATDTCTKCPEPWPCDTIAALDALETELTDTNDLWSKWYAIALGAIDALKAEHAKELIALQVRIDAATMLIRNMIAQDDRVHEVWDGLDEGPCPETAPFRAWLAGDKEAGNE